MAAGHLTYHRWVDGVFGVSADSLAEVRRVFHLPDTLPGAVIPNPLDPTRITAAPSGGARPPGPWQVGAVGSLEPVKGHDVLLRAFALARSRLGEARLTILGRGPLRHDLGRLAGELGLADVVSLPGWVEDPSRVMATWDAFAHPSRWEGQGMAILEAMAVGLPVVVTDCPGGPRELVDHGRAGLVVPTGDPVALADALVRLREDSDLAERLRRHGQARTAAFRPEAVASRLLDFCADIGALPTRRETA
jgi:glycosyltransferase involved in cell wall biosynthesis